jgi:two-component system, NtrC family, response regulator PilR
MGALIWVVDDDASIRDLLGLMLKDLGYGTELFASGKEMLARLDKHSPDLFVVDVRMPEMSGMDLTRAITEKDPHALVIILTGFPSIEDAVEAIQIGASDYLSKPFNKAQIQVRIERLLGKRRLQTRLKRTRLATRTLVETLPIWIILGMLAARYLW